MTFAIWSEPMPNVDSRENIVVEVISREDLEKLVKMWGTPNIIIFPSGEFLLEGRDWTRRERKNIPSCFEDTLARFI